MKTLAPIIEHLLLTTDCVVVEGLGGFVRRAEHARYDERRGLYLPPRAVVSFNARLTTDDGLLVEQLMLKEGVDYQGARRMIGGWVAQVEASLTNVQSYTIEGIGTLTRHRGEPMAFEPDVQACFAPSLYGLPGVSMVRKGLAGSRPAKPVEHLKKINLHGRSIAAVAAVVVLFVVATTSSLDLPRRTVNSPAVATIMGGFVFGENAVPLYQYNTSEKITAPAEKPAVVRSAQTKVCTVERQAAPPAKHYTLVLASQVTRTGAEALIARLKASGLPYARIDECGSMRRVVYSAYASEAEAQNALQKLRQQTAEAAEAWVLHRP